MHFLREGTFIAVVGILWASLIQPTLSKSLNDTEADPSSITCYKDNGDTPMVGDAPHPSDCNRYYTCVIGASGRAEPLLRECQSDHDGYLLYYSFRFCRCDYKDVAQCYDDFSEPDKNDFFICAGEATESDFPQV